MKVLALALALLVPYLVAHAQEPSGDAEGQGDVCEKGWGCWDLLYTTPGTVLGAKVTLTYTDADRTPIPLEAGFVTTYALEHFATRDKLSAHVVLNAGVGGGTAGNEGHLGFGLDVGFRGTITEKSGPFLRVGLTGFLLGHDALYLSLFEPFQGRIGYQWLDGDVVFEAGLTNGIVPVARFHPGHRGYRDLSRTKELGGYTALHFAKFRIDSSFIHLFDPDPGTDRDDAEIARASYCDYHLPVTLCGDALFARGEARFAGQERMTNSLYVGLTVGLSP